MPKIMTPTEGKDLRESYDFVEIWRVMPHFLMFWLGLTNYKNHIFFPGRGRVVMMYTNAETH